MATHLRVNDRVTELQKRETVEECRKDVQKDLAHDVRYISVVASERSLEQLLGLGPGRCRILARSVDVLGHGLALAFLLDIGDLFAQLLIFFAFLPDLGPVLVAGSPDNVDGPFTVMQGQLSVNQSHASTHLGLAPFSIFLAPFDSKYLIIVSPSLPMGPLYTVLPPRVSNSKSSNWNKSSELG